RSLLFSFLVGPRPLAAKLTFNHLPLAGDRLGELFREVVITADAVHIDAVEAEEGFAVRQIDFALHSSVTRHAGRVDVIDRDAERLELGKFEARVGALLTCSVRRRRYSVAGWVCGTNGS